ncbi:hypothetical protein HPB47_011773 [Ixodes persulcatus]|uniref:Uncharacterized protein n=1 Tax=Ixodes persulcatus TaxID=34615 RepID=A0AC60NVA5_IXOPE|nr:hypothetical protein HPB47_011773 [Ixodes persulcatus]
MPTSQAEKAKKRGKRDKAAVECEGCEKWVDISETPFESCTEAENSTYKCTECKENETGSGDPDTEQEGQTTGGQTQGGQHRNYKQALMRQRTDPDDRKKKQDEEKMMDKRVLVGAEETLQHVILECTGLQPEVPCGGDMAVALGFREIDEEGSDHSGDRGDKGDDGADSSGGRSPRPIPVEASVRPGPSVAAAAWRFARTDGNPFMRSVIVKRRSLGGRIALAVVVVYARYGRRRGLTGAGPTAVATAARRPISLHGGASAARRWDHGCGKAIGYATAAHACAPVPLLPLLLGAHDRRVGLKIVAAVSSVGGPAACLTLASPVPVPGRPWADVRDATETAGAAEDGRPAHALYLDGDPLAAGAHHRCSRRWRSPSVCPARGTPPSSPGPSLTPR